jgi:hypothetical protein
MIYESRIGRDKYIGSGIVTSADSASKVDVHTWTYDNTGGTDGAIAIAGGSTKGSALAGNISVLSSGPICPPGPTNPPPPSDNFFQQGNPGNNKLVGGIGEDPNGRGEGFWETGIRGRGK